MTHARQLHCNQWPGDEKVQQYFQARAAICQGGQVTVRRTSAAFLPTPFQSFRHPANASCCTQIAEIGCVAPWKCLAKFFSLFIIMNYQDVLTSADTA